MDLPLIIATSRASFEQWASTPPREWSLVRFGANSAWDGSYREYHVQCAWETWQHLKGQQPRVGSEERRQGERRRGGQP